MLRRHPTRGELGAQRKRRRRASTAAEEGGLQAVEQVDLLLRGKIRMIGDVVGAAYEIVEGKNRHAMARRNEPRRDEKILVAVAFTGPKVAGIHYCAPFTFDCTRPFHNPPRLRAYW